MVTFGIKASNFNNVFSRFIYSKDSIISTNMNVTTTQYDLYIAGIYIKDKNTIFTLFYLPDHRIILGEIDLSNNVFIIK